MPSIYGWICVNGFLLTISPFSMAQSGSTSLPRPQASSGIPSRPLLMEPAIQQEINLSPRQKKNLAQVQADADDSRQQAMSGTEDEGFDFNAMMGGVEDLERQRRAAIAKVLTTAQKTRLLQLEWQREGWMSLGRPDVASKIHLNQPQIEKIQSILITMRQAHLEAILPVSGRVPRSEQTFKTNPNLTPNNGFIDPGGGSISPLGPLNFDSDAFRAQSRKTIEAAEKTRDVAGKAIEEVLTSDQRTAFERLLGPKFDFDTLKTGRVSEVHPDPSKNGQKSPPKKSTKVR